ncbi:MAG: sodium-dependent bicarbonate transport family permease [Verrucomicrobiaceae bacterium]
MDFITAIQSNLLSPAVLFFVLGVFAAVSRSDLKFPEALYSTLTIYLLTAIGFKGGVAINEAGIGAVWLPALAAMLLGSVIPLWTYPVLRKLGKFSIADAGAIAAHYGSVSAVTFIAATNFLKSINEPFESYATAFLAVMESPAIIVGVILGKGALGGKFSFSDQGVRHALRDAVFGKGVLLLVGALLIGAVCGKRGMASVEGFFVTPFQGVLALFLMEMGMVAGRRIGDLKKVGAFLLLFGITAPLVHGSIGVLIGSWAGLSAGGATLLGVLAGSASYIAAPAAVRLSLPDANPAYSLTAALAITFPFNITVGIPLFFEIAKLIHA